MNSLPPHRAQLRCDRYPPPNGELVAMRARAGGSRPGSPPELRFRVVSSSSHDSGLPATALHFHGPLSLGWMSERLCEYPQRLLLQLPGPCRIRKVQLLCHESKIPSRVELHVGRGKSKDAMSVQRLGYLELDENQRSGYKVRRVPRASPPRRAHALRRAGARAQDGVRRRRR